MKHTLTLKGLQLEEDMEKVLKRQVGLLKRKLMHFAVDIPQFSFVIKKHDKNHFYSGIMTLCLPKKQLIARIGGHSVKDVIHAGLDKINKELEIYKGKHFKGSSKYPNHRPIKGGEYV
ncbi:MAG: hypothetical protein HY430_02550 [Candidatus Levybacteria bacterium]|nr:hypothetical protein [Candidatus Levybacteria bacterium]